MLDYVERDETWRRGVLKLSLRAGPTKLSAVSFSRSVESTSVYGFDKRTLGCQQNIHPE